MKIILGHGHGNRNDSRGLRLTVIAVACVEDQRVSAEAVCRFTMCIITVLVMKTLIMILPVSVRDAIG